MKTAITEMFGIDVPILAFTHCRDVVAAVSKAGGMGVLGAVAHTPEQLEIDLKWIEDEVGDRPYGVDLIVPAKYAGSDNGGLTMADIVGMIPDEHRRFVADLLAKYDVPPLPDDEASSRSRSGGDLSGTAAPSAIAAAIWRPRPMPPAPSTGTGATASTISGISTIEPTSPVCPPASAPWAMMMSTPTFT